MNSWQNAVDTIEGRRANVLILGDSISEGAWAATYFESWIHVMRRLLQTNLTGGPGGVGHIPAIRGFDGAGNAGFPASNGDQWTISNPAKIDRTSANQYGLGRRSVSLSSGESATIDFTGDRFQILYTSVPSGGEMGVSVDGGPAESFQTDSSSPRSGDIYTSQPLGQGAHSVTVSAVSGDVILDGGTFYDGDSSAGVTVWDGSHAGFSSTQFDGHDPQSTHWADGLTAISPDAVVIALGTNDANAAVSNGYTPGVFGDRLRSIIDLIATKVDTSIFMVLQPQPGYSPQVDPAQWWTEHMDAATAAAIDRDATVIDLRPAVPSGRSETGDLSPYYHNSNHPNSAGMRLYGVSMNNALIAHSSPAPDWSNNGGTLKYFEGSRWIDLTGDSVNVADFGAVGDGAVDDTQAFRTAVSFIESQGGGTLRLSAGKSYRLAGGVDTCENLIVEGNHARVMKTSNADTTSTVAFRSKSGQGLGYGAGDNRNLIIRNVIFQGNLSTDSAQQVGICGFAGHHHDNVTIDGCVFSESADQGHCIDLSGCSNVRILDSQFAGFNPTVSANSEAIRAGRSAYGLLSITELVGNYDGIATRNLTVSGCSFLPLTKNGVDWPCPNPLGSRDLSEEFWPENITFRDNRVEDPAAYTSSNQKGIIYFAGVRSLDIGGNTFVTSKARPNYVVMLEGSTTGAAAGSDPNAAVSLVSLANPINSEGVSISGNVFDGFYGRDSASSDGLIGTSAPGSDMHVNWRIEGNVFKNTVTELAENNDAPQTLSLYRVQDAVIANNTATMVGSLGYFNACKGVSIASNTASAVCTQSLYFANSSRVNISDLIVDRHYRMLVNIGGIGGNHTIRGVKATSTLGSPTTCVAVLASGSFGQISISDVLAETASDLPAVSVSSGVSNGIVSGVIANTTVEAVSSSGANMTVVNNIAY